jgi:putative flavoprotein involved in K+ transport
MQKSGSAMPGEDDGTHYDYLHLHVMIVLPGLPFPAPRHSFPSKDAMGDYLEQYAGHFNLPVRSGVKVDSLSRDGNIYEIDAGEQHFQAEHVVVAMSNFQYPKIPSFAKEIASGIVQLHSSAYKNPSQLQEGPVLVVGAGNSGLRLHWKLLKVIRYGWPEETRVIFLFISKARQPNCF